MDDTSHADDSLMNNASKKYFSPNPLHSVAVVTNPIHIQILVVCFDIIYFLVIFSPSGKCYVRITHTNPVNIDNEDECVAIGLQTCICTIPISQKTP